MTPHDHLEACYRHTAIAKEQVASAMQSPVVEEAAAYAAIAQVHATLAHMHAYMMIEALR